MERLRNRMAKNTPRKTRRRHAQRAPALLSQAKPNAREDRAKAAELALYHRRELTGVIYSPTQLLHFVIWVGCSALAGSFTVEEARAIAALLLPFAKLPGAFPLSIAPLLKDQNPKELA